MEMYYVFLEIIGAQQLPKSCKVIRTVKFDESVAVLGMKNSMQLN